MNPDNIVLCSSKKMFSPQKSTSEKVLKDHIEIDDSCNESKNNEVDDGEISDHSSDKIKSIDKLPKTWYDVNYLMRLVGFNGTCSKEVIEKAKNYISQYYYVTDTNEVYYYNFEKNVFVCVASGKDNNELIRMIPKSLYFYVSKLMEVLIKVTGARLSLTSG